MNKRLDPVETAIASLLRDLEEREIIDLKKYQKCFQYIGEYRGKLKPIFEERLAKIEKIVSSFRGREYLC